MIVAILVGAGPAPSASAVGGVMFVPSQEVVVIGFSDGVNRTHVEDGLTENLTEADVAPDSTVNPVTETVTVGARVSGNVSTDLATSDDVYVRYREAPGPPASVTTNAPAANGSLCEWTMCADGRASDNVSASSTTNLAVATYRGFGFALPQDAANLRVEVGYEAYEPAGNDRIWIAISWDGGATFCPAVAVNLPAADPNAFTFANLTSCTGHTWTGADFSGDSIVTRFTHTQVGGVTETLYLDANAVRVMYETNYRMDVRYPWSAIPPANRYVLTIEGGIVGEDVAIEVLTPPSTWNGRLALTSTTDRTLTYNLTTAEFNSGSPSIRFVDVIGPDDSASELRLDLVEVTAVALAYRLDVRHDITAIAGEGPVLVLKGHITPGGDDFGVEVWNLSSGFWGLRAPSAFGLAPAFANLTLRPEEIDGGVVRIRYTDTDPANPVAGRLLLDLVAVVVAVPATTPPDMILIGGGAAAVAASSLVLLVVLRRRSPAGEARDPASRVFPRLSSQAAEEVRPPAGREATASDLESGGSYLVEADSPAGSLKLLEDLTRIGRSGLFLTGRDPRAAVTGFKLRRTRSLHVGEPVAGEAGGSHPPSLERLLDSILEFLKTNPVGVVLIDGAEFLTERNEPRAVSRFLLQVADAVSRGQQIFLVTMGQAARGVRGLKAVWRRMDVVRPP